MIRSHPAARWFVAALGLYALSAARGPVWADSAKLTLYARHAYLPTLSPGDHAGYTLLASAWLRLVPWLGSSAAANLLSALAGAIAIAALWIVVSRRTESRDAAHSAAAVALVALPVWWAAAVAETYLPAIALALTAAVLARPDASGPRALLAGAAAGLAVASHAFAAVLAVPLVLALPRRRWLAVAAGAALGFAPAWLGMFLHPPDPFTGHTVAGLGSWGWHLRHFLVPRHLVTGLALVAAVMGYGLGPIGAVGMAARLRRDGLARGWRNLVLAAGSLALALVIGAYSPYRVHVMCAFLVVAAVVLVPPRLSALARAAHAATQAAIYAVVPLLLVAAGHGGLGVRELPDRVNAWYFLSPVKAFDHGAGRYARELLFAVPPQAVILADFNPGAPLRLVQEMEQVRPDVSIVPTAVDEALAAHDPAQALAARITAAMVDGRPVVLADRWPPYYHPDRLEQFGFALAPCGPGWRVRLRR